MAGHNEIKHKLCKEIAQDLGGSLKEVQSVVDSQFKHAFDVIAKGEFKAAKIPYIGKFHALPGRIKNVNNINAIIQRRRISGNS